ncbi:hypothetical protein [Anabaena sp. CCY 9402-a]|uniref:hypothetical protein n=1 Tax=Anabaena sp. CCY 9402-a TaxID=3103867 RepID=UPI0039C5F16A
MKATHAIASITFGTSIGFLIGIGLASGSFKESYKISTVGGIGAFLGGAIAHLIYDGKMAKREREINSQHEKFISEMKATAKSDRLNIEAKFNHEKRELQNLLTQTQNALNQLQSESRYKDATVDRLNADIARLEIALKEHRQQVAELERENLEWSSSFETGVASEVQKQVNHLRQTEIKKIFDDHDKVVAGYRDVVTELKDVLKEVRRRNHAQREFVVGAAEKFNSTLETYADACEEAQEDQLTLIDTLKLKIARLEMQLQGDISEPQLMEERYNPNIATANDLAREIFLKLRIPLIVKGVDVNEGVTTVGFGYSKSDDPSAIVEAIEGMKKELAHRLDVCKITSIRKLPITDCIAIAFRREPALTQDSVKNLIGSPQEFIDYIITNPIRYRIMADPGTGKTPSMAVMVSEILKAGGGKRMNMANGKRLPTLVSVAYPDALSSAKDAENYPLKPFLKYGDSTAAIKSFKDACDDWDYRKHDIKYSEKFFQLWCWEEFDYTLGSADDPKAITDKLKLLLQKGGHNNIGYIVSGQTIMTKAIAGFTNDDRSMFIEMVIGVDKIRKYLNTYGKGRNSDSQLAKLTNILDDIEEYIENQNNKIVDSARYLRLALIRDERSPKLYFLPNLDLANFDINEIEATRQLAENHKRGIAASLSDGGLVQVSQNAYTQSTSAEMAVSPIPTMLDTSPLAQNRSKPHCPHCGSPNLSLQNGNRYYCKDCKKRTVGTKMIWK